MQIKAQHRRSSTSGLRIAASMGAVMILLLGTQCLQAWFSKPLKQASAGAPKRATAGPRTLFSTIFFRFCSAIAWNVTGKAPMKVILPSIDTGTWMQ